MRLEFLLQRSSQPFGLKKFTRDELYELGRLYRKLSSDLAKAKTIEADRDIIEYFNSLLSKVYHVIYRSERQPVSSFTRFVTETFPRCFRRQIVVILISAFVFFVPAIWAYFAYLNDPVWTEVALAPAMRNFYEQRLEEEGPSELAVAIKEGEMGAMSTLIILNNIQVAIYAFSGGVLFGVGTLLILLQNGLALGMIAAIFITKGSEFSLYFYSGVLPHGVLELPAICLAGGAGLLLAKGMFIPGRKRRLDAVKDYGREAITLVLGTVMILVIAGLIEGFITPIKIDGDATVPSLMYAKLGFSSLAFMLLIAYFLLAGRKRGEIPLDDLKEHLKKVKSYSPRGIYRVLTSDNQEF